MSSPENSASENAVTASVKSAARVLSIFEYFEKRRMPRTLSEISQDLDYPVSSALALLRSVQAMGYLNYDFNTKTYFPSLRFVMLGQWIHEELFKGGVIVQMMEHLSVLTEETVLLGAQNGLHSQHIHIVHASHSLRYQPLVGTMKPLLRSSTGKVLLANQPKAAVLKIIERTNALGIDDGRTYDPKEVFNILQQVRRDGYAFTANVLEGVSIITVALPPSAGDVPMTISVGGPSTRINEVSVPKLIQQINGAISDFLGQSNDDGVSAAKKTGSRSRRNG